MATGDKVQTWGSQSPEAANRRLLAAVVMLGKELGSELEELYTRLGGLAYCRAGGYTSRLFGSVVGCAFVPQPLAAFPPHLRLRIRARGFEAPCMKYATSSTVGSERGVGILTR